VRDPSTVKVLLVEDNQVNMRVATAILKRLGFDAATAANGLEAISKMHGEVFDIVFMVRRERVVVIGPWVAAPD
jgi:CheY-like chemotaxis protein